ncbi:thymocyte nuclear protein 1 [Triplophysa dalaica]|uniref:thymocyte nuclear protein 1 n=1 Tax=Triplophysa dalaica TaxID=1582913 RepID=UPI0024E01EEB|nr:thymocyte nuclear protein 1 [Triplophysa dalaica]
MILHTTCTLFVDPLVEKLRCVVRPHAVLRRAISVTSMYRESDSKTYFVLSSRDTVILHADRSAQLRTSSEHISSHWQRNMPPKKITRSSAKSNKHTEEVDAQQNVNEESDDSRTGKRKRSAAVKLDVKKNKSDETAKASYSHWLMKSEPETRIENGVDVKFGIEDLKVLPNQTGCWDGVRNYQARNFMRDMRVGQQAFFYHSNCKEPGIAGLMKIVKEAYVDHTQFDKKDPHYDPSSKPDNPKWSMVDVQFERMTKRFIPLSELKNYHLQHKVKGGPLKDVALFTRARLSVQPLTAAEFDFVLSLENVDLV